jgi:glucose-6-phosphate 1-dehydrogenase
MAATEDRQLENPLEEGLLLRRTPDPCALVVFGASGDLTHKKLMPALYSLMVRRLLPARFVIVGVARTDGDDDAFRDDMKDAVQKHGRDEFRQDVWDELAQNMHYVATDFSDDDGEFRRQRFRRSSRPSADRKARAAGHG